MKRHVSDVREGGYEAKVKNLFFSSVFSYKFYIKLIYTHKHKCTQEIFNIIISNFTTDSK